MEYCYEARALKSSFVPEIAMKSTQQVFIEDLWCVTGINNVSCDDFSVDDLLDFSDKDFKDGSVGEKDSLSVSSQDRVHEEDTSNSTTFSGTGEFGSLTAGDFSVPVDDMENLEWLSQFVDDSASEVSLLCPAGSLEERTGKCFENRSEPEVPVPCFPTPVQGKARSKRSRPSGRVWSLGSPSLTDSSTTSSSSYGSNSSSFIITSPVHTLYPFSSYGKPPAKKQKRNPATESGSGSSGSQPQRRCTHCHVQKTPQWRTGPLGAKTLCNACGVRFKSGRLFPEYRPACSPTFSGDIHSNSHRKVLEMRRTKETAEIIEPGFASLVPIC
ncbi:unnamed protein product [Ilex paraguariensis]|uniref:GATA transcription factor n=1 Tax=Ilex paraguariensis TaxID=185542 RepID=A0ABC8RCT5_9AQUA